MHANGGSNGAPSCARESPNVCECACVCACGYELVRVKALDASAASAWVFITKGGRPRVLQTVVPKAAACEGRGAHPRLHSPHCHITPLWHCCNIATVSGCACVQMEGRACSPFTVSSPPASSPSVPLLSQVATRLLTHPRRLEPVFVCACARVCVCFEAAAPGVHGGMLVRDVHDAAVQGRPRRVVCLSSMAQSVRERDLRHCHEGKVYAWLSLFQWK